VIIDPIIRLIKIVIAPAIRTITTMAAIAIGQVPPLRRKKVITIVKVTAAAAIVPAISPPKITGMMTMMIGFNQ
jgi:hypothetical protein